MRGFRTAGVLLVMIAAPRLTAAGQAAQGTANVTIPLCAGLTLVGAVSEPRGDYEPIVTVQSIAKGAVNVSYSTQARTRQGILQQINVQRSVLLADLQSATFHHRWFSPSAPRTVRGSTAFSLSTAVLRALKSKGTVDLGLVDRGDSALPADPDVHPNIYDYVTVFPLTRVGTSSVPVTVNDVKVELPAIHATGSVMGDTFELFIHDDERNPLSLKTRRRSIAAGGETELTQLVKVSYRCRPETAAAPAPAATSRLEEALLKTGRAEVFDIYFAFNSDVIRQESEPTLEEIAALLRRQLEWKLGIEGHTDSIADDAYNMDLSRRRADAVKTALMTRFAIQAARLTTAGFGESRPKDRNDTLEGRARNRRVELVRQ